MAVQRKGHGGRLGCVCQQGIGRIDIEIEIFWKISRDATARELIQICQC